MRLTLRYCIRRCFAALLLLVAGHEIASARSTSPIPEAATVAVLAGFSSQTGAVLYVTITGKKIGTVYGNNPYASTANSSLATAAVHAGLVADGVTKVVKLSFTGSQVSFPGSVANGVTSNNYPTFGVSYALAADDGGDNPPLNDPGDLRSFEVGAGSVYRFQVKASSSSEAVWGTNNYTSNSLLAVVALHAGVLPNSQNGIVRVVMGTSQSGFVGSTSNGVSSSSFGQIAVSYSVASDRGTTAILAYPGMLNNPLTDPGTGGLVGFRGRDGASVYFSLLGSLTGTVLGTDSYADDSDLATAAVHSGALKAGQRGTVKVTFQPGETSYYPFLPYPYKATTSNGVTSKVYGTALGAFSIAAPDGSLGAIPLITSPVSASAKLQQAFGYVVSSNPPSTTGKPVTYNATGLPLGIDINSASGVISGVPMLSGVFPVQLLARGGAGTSNASLLLDVAALPPVVSVPNFLTLFGPASVQSGARANLTAVARYADGSTRNVAPIWTSSNLDAALIDSSGLLSAGGVTVNTQVTLTARWTDNGATVQSTLKINVTAASSALVSLSMSSPPHVQPGGKVRITSTAFYADGSSRQVSSSGFTLTNPALGSVNGRGEFTAAVVSSSTLVNIGASYSEGGISKSAGLAIIIDAGPSTLTRLTVISPKGAIGSSQSVQMVAEGIYADGSRKTVNATWSATGDASMSSSGLLTAKTLILDSIALCTAKFTEGGVATTAQFLMVIQGQVLPTPVQAEVLATGTQKSLGLSFWVSPTAPSSANLLAARSPVVPTAVGRPAYKLFVAAQVPAGPLLPTPAFFLLNRNHEWQRTLEFPLAEYLSNVDDNSFQLIELFDQFDATIISGTKLFVGYGVTDTEMIQSGRFRLVYQVQ